MKIVRWNPMVNQMRMINEFERLANQQLNWPAPNMDVNLGLAIDVAEKEDGFTVKASLPGVNPDDVEIMFEDDVLTIKGEIQEDQDIAEDSYHIRERPYGSFGRSIRFPLNVNVDGIEATYENGVLVLNVPKVEEVKPKRISVKVN